MIMWKEILIKRVTDIVWKSWIFIEMDIQGIK